MQSTSRIAPSTYYEHCSRDADPARVRGTRGSADPPALISGGLSHGTTNARCTKREEGLAIKLRTSQARTRCTVERLMRQLEITRVRRLRQSRMDTRSSMRLCRSSADLNSSTFHQPLYPYEPATYGWPDLVSRLMARPGPGFVYVVILIPHVDGCDSARSRFALAGSWAGGSAVPCVPRWCSDALEQALWSIGNTAGLIHHQ